MVVNLKISIQAFLTLMVFTLILGGAYPLGIYIINQFFFSKKANNSLIFIEAKVVGSKLLGQNFTQGKYFWGRPSNIEQHQRIDKYNQEQKKHNLPSILSPDKFPADFIFSSASGVDPHISMQSAMIQSDRVEKETGIDPKRLQFYILSSFEPRQFGFIGQPRVNVVKLNLLIHAQQK